MLFMKRVPRRCYWCGRHLTKKNTKRASSATLDHLIPKSRGGGHGDNKVPCCKACNTRKGCMTAEEYEAHLRSKSEPTEVVP
jgi:5-methylcytosine-specific restriction endonuclease McrA